MACGGIACMGGLFKTRFSGGVHFCGLIFILRNLIACIGQVSQGVLRNRVAIGGFKGDGFDIEPFLAKALDGTLWGRGWAASLVRGAARSRAFGVTWSACRCCSVCRGEGLHAQQRNCCNECCGFHDINVHLPKKCCKLTC